MFGENWTATYYNSTDLSGAVAFVEVLPKGINVNWGVGSPHQSVRIDNFSARFTSVQHFDAAIYEFVVSSDAGVRVYIDDALVLDRFVVRILTTDRFRIPIPTGEHSLKVEYFAAVGQAAIQVQWYAAGRFIEAPKVKDQPKPEQHEEVTHASPNEIPFGTYRVLSLEGMLPRIFGEVSTETDESLAPFFRIDSPYYFRGQAKSEWGLVPTIFRAVKSSSDAHTLRKILQLEREIYNAFSEQSRAYLPTWIDRNNPWEILCVAQHFGVPTRLLDWTSNFLAATYFAVSDESSFDGAVWCLSGQQLEKYPFAENNRPRHTNFSSLSLDTHTSFFDGFAVDKVVKSDFFTTFHPPHIDNRIKNQAGVFSVYVSFADPKETAQLVYDHSNYFAALPIPLNNELLFKFVIASEAKKQIKSKLEKMGINYSYLFPDLNGLGKYFEDQRKQKFASIT